MNIVFLDIDGVLNTERYIIEQYNKTGRPHSGHHSEFDPICMQNLKEFVLETNSNIVISSVWRFCDKDTDEGWKALLSRLSDYGMEGRVISWTPSLSREFGTICCRGHEIQKWLDDNKDKMIENFVIIDDDSDMYHLMPFLAKCNHRVGFTKDIKEEALKIMRGDNNEACG
jgi:hypothetical protein